jgi:hypothetical protein
VSTPDEIVQQQLAAGLDVTGTAAAGMYGEASEVSPPPPDMDLSAAVPAEADIDALRARLAALEAAQQEAAAKAAPAPEPEVPDLTPVLSSSVASDVREAFQRLHERILAIETGLGL